MPWSTEVEELVDQARRGGAVLVFDIDDLVFDPKLAEQMPFWAQASKLTRCQYNCLSHRLQRTLEACDAFIGATPALARAAEALGKRALVYPNLLHPGLIAAARRIRKLRAARPPGPVVGYMSGSMTHNEDFARVAPILNEIMSRRPEVILQIGGFLDIDSCLERFADRIIRLPFQDWRVQPWSTCLMRLNLAPLAVVNDFTNGKSALKFSEAAIVGVPTVATPTESFRAAIKHGVNGFLADDPEEWREAITAGLDEQVSKRVGSAATDAALAEHSPAPHRCRLSRLLRSINGRAVAQYDGWLPIPADNADPADAPGIVRRLLSRVARSRSAESAGGVRPRSRRPRCG
jgi:glycosyltransferase involved in cell wall biosynthesis